MLLNILTACLCIVSTIPDSSVMPVTYKTDSSGVYPKLTVNSKVDAVGTENATEGTRELEEFPGYYIHVPKNALGKKKVPLVVMIHGRIRNGLMEVEKFRGLSEKHGMILLTVSSIEPGYWDVVRDLIDGNIKYSITPYGVEIYNFKPRDVYKLDSALKYVLNNQAIDPERIALVGFSDGGSYSYFLGRNNQKFFSRIAPLSAMAQFYGEDDPQSKSQFFISGGLGEGPLTNQVTRMAALLRSKGHSVKTQIGLRGHVDYVEDQEFVWQWFKNSWDNPKVTDSVPATRDSEVLLSLDALDKLSTFWDGFIQLPDSIRNTSRMKEQREVWVRVGNEWSTVIMMDLKTMCELHPQINDLLSKAGLTVEAADMFRRSIIETVYTIEAGFDQDPPDSSSVIGKTLKFKPVEKSSVLYKNIEFYKENKDRFRELFKLKILGLQ